MGSFTAFLSEVSLDDLRQAGGKGANLGHLIRAGFPVPPGFCVLAEAYDALLGTSGLRERISFLLRDVYFYDALDVEMAAAKIREAVVSSPVPHAIEVEIASAYRELTHSAEGGIPVAVRSSAGTRDLGLTSFPGQLDTFHNLRSLEEVLQKVRECWASAFSYRALVNRHALGIGHFDVFVAPVVQLMLDPECAGVIFTADPVSGDRDRMVINSCLGLGEGVVSGKAACDHYVLDKETGVTLEERIASKEFKFAPDAEKGSGVRKVALAPEEGVSPSLSPQRLSRLVETARAIEQTYDCPQDIEWAFAGDELFILQSRPVRVRGEGVGKGEEPPQEWVCEFDSTVDPAYPYYTRSNISEVLPGVLTPLSISDINSLDYGFVKCNSDLGLMKGINPRSEFTFLGIFYGRAHLNLSVYRAVVSKVPGATTKEFDRRPPEEIGEDEVEGWKPTPRSVAALPAIFARLLYRAAVTPREAAALGKKYESMLASARGRDYEAMPYAEIFASIDEVREDLYRVMALHIAASQFAVTYFDLLRRATARWLGDADGVLAARLVTGLQEVESALPSMLIWDLSRTVKSSPYLTRVFTSTAPARIRAILESAEHADADRFLEELRAFLDRFGYRGVFEAEAMVPNWEQDPAYVFALIRNYLDADPAYSPREMTRRQERERERAVREALGGLKGARRMVLRYLVRQAQAYISMREYVKALIVKGLAHGKTVFSTVGRRLAAEGTIRDREDVFFLTHREIEMLATGGGTHLPVDELVARRRREYAWNLGVVLPEYSRGRPRPLTARELEARGDIDVLEGTGVSPGRATGKARVITDPIADAEIRPGEILVAPVTDAAWTPLFVTAAATVVDVGGPLSHGSIVAREFGIPCVVNVGKATMLVRTGQVITVDGGAGKVYLHPGEK